MNEYRFMDAGELADERRRQLREIIITATADKHAKAAHIATEILEAGLRAAAWSGQGSNVCANIEAAYIEALKALLAAL